MTKKDAFDIYKEDNEEEAERFWDDVLGLFLIIPVIGLIILVIVAR